MLFVPALEENLLSVRKLTEKGNQVTFKGDACYITCGKEQWNVATFKEGLYRVQARARDRAQLATLVKPVTVFMSGTQSWRIGIWRISWPSGRKD